MIYHAIFREQCKNKIRQMDQTRQEIIHFLTKFLNISKIRIVHKQQFQKKNPFKHFLDIGRSRNGKNLSFIIFQYFLENVLSGGQNGNKTPTILKIRSVIRSIVLFPRQKCIQTGNMVSRINLYTERENNNCSISSLQSFL